MYLGVGAGGDIFMSRVKTSQRLVWDDKVDEASHHTCSQHCTVLFGFNMFSEGIVAWFFGILLVFPNGSTTSQFSWWYWLQSPISVFNFGTQLEYQVSEPVWTILAFAWAQFATWRTFVGHICKVQRYTVQRSHSSLCKARPQDCGWTWCGNTQQDLHWGSGLSGLVA